MTKSTTIEAIRTLNPTASPDFLAEFSPDELSQYLERLNRASPERPLEDSVRSKDPPQTWPTSPDELTLL